MYWMWVLLISSGLFLYNLNVVENNLERIDFPRHAECESYDLMPNSSVMVIRIKGETPRQCFFKRGIRVVFDKNKTLIDEQIEQRLPFYKDNSQYTINRLTPPTHILEKSSELIGLLNQVKLKLVNVRSGEIEWTYFTSHNPLAPYLRQLTQGFLFFLAYLLLYYLGSPLRKFMYRRKQQLDYQNKYQIALKFLRDERILQGVDLLLECANQAACTRTRFKATSDLKDFIRLQSEDIQCELKEAS